MAGAVGSSSMAGILMSGVDPKQLELGFAIEVTKAG